MSRRKGRKGRKAADDFTDVLDLTGGRGRAPVDNAAVVVDLTRGGRQATGRGVVNDDHADGPVRLGGEAKQAVEAVRAGHGARVLSMPLAKESEWWSRSRVSKTRTAGLDHAEFSRALHHSIRNQLARCRVIDVPKGEERWVLEDITVKVTEDGFAALADAASSHPVQELCPLLTFHGTSNSTVVNSITKYGYLMPGEQHPVADYCNSMRTGNLYGDGVYSSPQFDVAHWYAALDMEDKVQLVVNVVLPGKVRTTV